MDRGDGVDIRLTVRSSPYDAPRSRWRVLGNDFSRLGQVFNNLIDNGRSFSKPGGVVRVLLWPERAKGPGGQQIEGFEIIVDDDGPGIPDGAFERIFERFYTDRPEQGFGQNSGLGLSISRPDHRGAWRTHPRAQPHPRASAGH